ncbi:hypothetical protein [Cellulomonas sp. NS3]|uniref:hypothetical protein n=1 Tax=Cellulomonas sp. NS3 TaxID=2973977 RepID=UPI00216224F3|nr:hypothetical protein [Cellulomonas sp. NS3]
MGSPPRAHPDPRDRSGGRHLGWRDGGADDRPAVKTWVVGLALFGVIAALILVVTLASPETLTTLG